MTPPQAYSRRSVVQGVFVRPFSASAAGRNAVQARSATQAGATIQRRPGIDAFQVNLTPKSGGWPLPRDVQAKMESALNANFSDVRIHVGPEASAIGAIAFTWGSDIHFAPGQYNPHTPHGQSLLGHELTHVVQQRAGRVANPFGSGVAVVQDQALEAEADRMGRVAATHRPAETGSSSTPGHNPSTQGPVASVINGKVSPTAPPIYTPSAATSQLKPSGVPPVYRLIAQASQQSTGSLATSPCTGAPPVYRPSATTSQLRPTGAPPVWVLAPRPSMRIAPPQVPAIPVLQRCPTTAGAPSSLQFKQKRCACSRPARSQGTSSTGCTHDAAPTAVQRFTSTAGGGTIQRDACYVPDWASPPYKGLLAWERQNVAVGPDEPFTPQQRVEIYKVNRATHKPGDDIEIKVKNSDQVVKSDGDGSLLITRRDLTFAMANVDHVVGRAQGGCNSVLNAQVLAESANVGAMYMGGKWIWVPEEDKYYNANKTNKTKYGLDAYG